MKELMADAKVYGWASMQACHAVWLQQIENGRAQWMDEDAKLEFKRAVWNAAPQATEPSQPLGRGYRQEQPLRQVAHCHHSQDTYQGMQDIQLGGLYPTGRTPSPAPHFFLLSLKSQPSMCPP